ncbi:MAG: serine/threonine-protein kinase [Myxococcota bacterium]
MNIGLHSDSRAPVGSEASEGRPSGDPLGLDSGQPTHLGRYVVLQEVGRGGMGVVWTAYDPKLDRKVAIKLLSGSPRAGTRQARFIREAQALAKLNHPNIVTVHDVDTHDGQLYMAMELVDGQTLRRWLKKRRSWREIVEVFEQAGQGLAAAHAADITHRDFKPSNVLIARDGRVKVLDFGLAKHMGRDPLDDDEREFHSSITDPNQGNPGRSRRNRSAPSGNEDPPAARPKLRERTLHSDEDIMEVIGSSAGVKLTKVGRIVGTPAYMAPEQYPSLGRYELGPWTDQFSFGVALYEALYGDLPFAGNDLLETHTNIQAGRIREPRRDDTVPGWIFRLLQRALREDPAERFRSMDALLEALRADPAKKTRRIAMGLGALGLVALSSFGMVQALTKEEPVPCQGAQEHLRGIWDEATRASVRQGLVGTKLPYAADTARRVGIRLDDYAEAWVEQRTSVCEATRIRGEQSETLLDVRMTCLDRRLSELGALVRVLGAPEAQTVSQAVAMAAKLRPPEVCASAQPGVENAVPEDPKRRTRFLAIQAQLDEAQALMEAGRHAQAREKAAAAGQEAARQGFRQLLAQARINEGSTHERLRQADQAQHLLQEGIMLASEVEDARTEVLAWIELLSVVGVQSEERQLATAWRFAAEAALQRAGAPKDLEFRLQLNIAAVMLNQNRFDEATRVNEEALRIALEVGGYGSLQHARVLNNLGIIAGHQADWILAERRLRESYDLKKELLGPDHPEVAGNGMNLANVQGQYAKTMSETNPTASERAYDEAERLYEQIISFCERTYGPTSHKVARTLAMLGLVQRNRGDLAKARHSYERALTVLRGLSGFEGDLARSLNNIAQLDLAEKNYEQAETHHREALAIQLGKYGESNLSVGRTRLQLCSMLNEAERHAVAVKECERALAVLEKAYEGRPNPSLTSAHDLLAGLYKALGQGAKSEQHRRKADEQRRRVDATGTRATGRPDDLGRTMKAARHPGDGRTEDAGPIAGQPTP